LFRLCDVGSPELVVVVVPPVEGGVGRIGVVLKQILLLSENLLGKNLC
jgi:hypothetical protein